MPIGVHVSKQVPPENSECFPSDRELSRPLFAPQIRIVPGKRRYPSINFAGGFCSICEALTKSTQIIEFFRVSKIHHLGSIVALYLRGMCHIVHSVDTPQGQDLCILYSLFRGLGKKVDFVWSLNMRVCGRLIIWVPKEWIE